MRAKSVWEGSWLFVIVVYLEDRIDGFVSGLFCDRVHMIGIVNLKFEIQFLHPN